MSACLSVCPVDYSKTYKRILMKVFGRMWRGPRNNLSDFGNDLNHDTDLEIC